MSLPDPFWKSDCGDYVLYCGRCEELVDRISFDAVIADPPYGVNHNPGCGRMSKIGGGIANDDSPPDVRWMAEYPSVVWGGNNFCDQLPRSTGWLIWDKTHAETCEHSQAELAWTNAVRTIRWHRQAYHGFMRQRYGWFHQHQKPIELMEWCLEFIPDGETILDPFTGSGTTGVACIRTGRKFIGIELEPKYCAIARDRMKRELAQGRLFKPAPEPKAKQRELTMETA